MKMNAEITNQCVNDGMVLLDMQTEKIFCLKKRESRILNDLLSMSVEDTISKAQENFDGDKTVIKQDIETFVKQLIEKGVLEPIK